MNADEMMYELGFKKWDKYTDEDKMMYYCLTENDHWIVRFFQIVWYCELFSFLYSLV